MSAGGIQLAGICVVLVAAFIAYNGYTGREGCVGIDLGTTYSVVAVRRVETEEVEVIVDWETGATIVPSVVAFGSGAARPVAGAPARLALHTHPESTLYNAKRFVGRPFADPVTVAEAPLHPFAIVPGPMMPPPPGANYGNAAQQAKAKRRWQERAATAPDYTWFRLPATAARAATRVNPRTVGAHVLARLRASVAAVLGHDVARKAVMAHPVDFMPHQLEETRLAFLSAGYNVVRMIDEPTAAAVAYGLHNDPSVHFVLIFDFGGGTLDCSVLYINDGLVQVLETTGDRLLGGEDFDQRMVGLLVASLRVQLPAAAAMLVEPHSAQTIDNAARCAAPVDFALLRPLTEGTSRAVPDCSFSVLKQGAERLKRELSSSLSATFQCAIAACDGGGEGRGRRALRITVTREAYEAACADLYERAMAPVHEILSAASTRPSDIDEIVLVGGSSRLPKVRSLLFEIFDKAPNDRIDPDLCVAIGAASLID